MKLLRLSSRPLLALAAACVTFAACAASDYPNYSYFHAIEIDDGRGLADLLRRGADPNLRDDQGQVALFVALRGNSLKAAKVLWEAPTLDVDARSPADETPLMMAALRGETEAAAALVARGAAVRKDGWTPLHYAATGGSVPIIRMLLDHGAELEARSPNGTTPLMMAAGYGSEEAVDALLAAGADRTVKNQRGWDAVEFARASGRDFLVKRLQAAGLSH